MTSGPQRKDFVIVPVPHKSTKVDVTSLQSSNVTVTSPPQQQSTLVPAFELSSARVVPPSLFWKDTDNHQESSNPPLELPDLPFDPNSTNPLDTADSIIDDSLGSTGDNASLHSDPDEPQLSGEILSDAAAVDMNVADTALVNPRDPRGPCAVTFGSIHDLHETHQGVLTKAFEKCFTFAEGSQTVHYPPGYTDDTGSHGTIIHVPLLPTSASSTSFLSSVPLAAHSDDDMLLSDNDKHDHQNFENRIAYLCTHWLFLHTCKSLLDIKTCLDKLDARSFHLLVALHVAYFRNQVNLDLSFGQTKQNFYLLAHQGYFHYDTFDTYPYQVPLATVTVKFFLIRPVSQ
jgi:hypothetical protein